MPRKTYEVEKLVSYVNGFCAAKGGSQDARQALMGMLEDVLRSTGNYGGFRYLVQEELSEIDLPGIHWDGNNPDFVNTDGTRVRYLGFAQN